MKPSSVTVGQRFGRLVVIEQAPRNSPNNHRMWVCRCDCGSEKTVVGSELPRGRLRSCGCLRRDLIATKSKGNEYGVRHGGARLVRDGRFAPEYRCWRGMIQRCEQPTHIGYKDYGGRGITVCKRWRESYAAFLADMGRKPSLKHSIDRYPDNDGDYEPGNCRWATAKEQSANQRARR